ncbi:adhesin transport system outer membrane protein [Mesorhizobium sp. J18]|nr:adhesin transport system outer membrane protein [Mesorhizobium sp. J18]
MAIACMLLSSCTTADPTLNHAPQTPSTSARISAGEGQQESSTAGQQPAGKPAAGSSAGGSAITLESAVRMALAWHPSIDEAIGRLNESAAEVDVARAGYLPQVRAGIDSAYENGTRNGWRPRFSVSASQMIYDFGQVAGSVEARAAGADVSRAQLLLGIDTLIRDTANAVIEVQRYRALSDVAQTQLAGVQAIADLVRQRSDRGASTRSDEIQADARVQAAQSTVLEISAELGRWETVLANLIGRGGPVSVLADAPQWLLNACSAAEPDWSQVPAVMEAEARQAEASAQLGVTRAQSFPTLSLEANAGYDLNHDSSSSRASTEEPDLSVGLRLSGNLYDGGATAARRTAADSALNAARAATSNSRLQVSSAFMEARAQTSSLQQLLASLSGRQDMMRETRDLYRQQYVELGTRTLLDLLNAEQELHQAGFDTANAIHDLRRLGIACIFNTGKARKAFSVDGMAIRGVTL